MRPSKNLRRLVDVAIPPPYPGRQVWIKTILNQEVVITDFTYIPSQFEGRLDYLAVRIERDGEDEWFATSSGFIVNFFERVSKDALPCRFTLSRTKDESGQHIYSID